MPDQVRHDAMLLDRALTPHRHGPARPGHPRLHNNPSEKRGRILPTGDLPVGMLQPVLHAREQ